MREITNDEAIEMMNRCRHEILRLHAEIDHLKPKAEAYDILAMVLRMVPQPSTFAWDDSALVRALEDRLKDLAPTPKATNAKS